MGMELPEEVDHKNRVRNDDAWLNLRPSYRLANSHNCGKYAEATSKYPGVSWDTRNRKWVVQIAASGVKHFIGRFVDELDAAMAFAAAKLELHIHYGDDE